MTIETLDDVRILLRDLPSPDHKAQAAAIERESSLTKPAGSLGRLETLAQFLSAWQGRHPPTMTQCRTAVFAGNHGVTAQGVSAYPAEVTAQMVQNFVHGGAAVSQLVRSVGGDLRIYPITLDTPTRDFSVEPAMTDAACAAAIATGMTAVEPGLDVIALGEMGIGNTTSAAALCHALFGGKAQDWVGAGTGLDAAGIVHKATVIAAAVARHKPLMTDPLEILRCVGGVELAAILGAVIAARQQRIPVLLDGYVCTAAAAVLFALDKAALDHCVVAHRSVEPGHSKLVGILGQEPLFDFGMRLGEASGSTLAIAVLKAAVACHTGMASFDLAGVSRGHISDSDL